LRHHCTGYVLNICCQSATNSTCRQTSGFVSEHGLDIMIPASKSWTGAPIFHPGCTVHEFSGCSMTILCRRPRKQIFRLMTTQRS
jgi:hypothetical protein